VPGAPANVNAVAGNASATVAWTAPSSGGSPLTSYTVTPYIGSVAQTPTTVTGSPPATSATITGLSNGTSYTFTVTATNGVGTGSASAASNAITPSPAVVPAFVQAISAHAAGVTTLSATPNANVTTGNRLVVEVGAWSAGHATTSSVTDSASDPFTELLHFTASDGTEMSVWSAPITSGGGTRPTITAKTTSGADVGVAAVEYSGLSTVADASVVDQSAHATGTTASATTVSSGPTAATTSANELAVGFYADSGFGDNLTADPGYTPRINNSPAGDMEFLLEDGLVPLGGTPKASAGTGPNTIWLMAAIVLKHA
jgi:hypothetical protein